MTLPGLLTFMFSDRNSYILYIADILNSVSYIFCGASLTTICMTPLILIMTSLQQHMLIQKSSFNALFSVVTYVLGLIDTFGYLSYKDFYTNYNAVH